MKKEIVISEADDLAVVFENGRAVEFVLRQGDQLVGDIVLGKVESVVPAIEAAFINIGHDKNGFIHVADLPMALSPRKRSKPQPIRTGEKLLVQIAKAPTGTKGARLTGRLSIPGRYLVFVPHDNRVCLSRMITEPRERDRLRSIATDLKDPGHGLIVRTEAVNCSEEELRRDVDELIEKWTEILHGAQMKSPPALLYRDNDLLTRVLRDRLTADTERIIVGSQESYQRAREMLGSWMPEMVRNLTVHRGRTSLVQQYRINEEIEAALKPKVNLPSGGSIVVETTEALTVIDVNSGKLTNSRSLAETVLKTNLEAATEIARQLRLRDIGGIIIVDFISMDHASDVQKIVAQMNEAIKADKSRPQLSAQFSEHGLMELSRRRQGQSLLEQLTKFCPSCMGLGRLRNEILPAERGAMPAPSFEAHPPRNAEEAAVALVEELIDEPLVVEAPTYPPEGPRQDLLDEEEELKRRRRRRRGRRGRGRDEEGRTPAESGAGPVETYEPAEVEELQEVPEAPGFTFEAVELDAFQPTTAAPFARPEREGRDRGDRERGRGRNGGRDRRPERSEGAQRPGRYAEPAAAAFAAPAVTAIERKAEPEGPSPWGTEATPGAVASSVIEAPVRVFRPKSRPRARMVMVEIAPGVMQLMPVEEGAEVPTPQAIPVEPSVELAAAAPAIEAVEETAAPEAAAAIAETTVRKVARRRPVKKGVVEEVEASEAPAEAPEAPLTEPEASTEVEETTIKERAPARRRATRGRQPKA